MHSQLYIFNFTICTCLSMSIPNYLTSKLNTTQYNTFVYAPKYLCAYNFCFHAHSQASEKLTFKCRIINSYPEQSIVY